MEKDAQMSTLTPFSFWRWLSKDPIGISGGLNQYVFCGNNPINFTDAFGLRWFGGGDDGWTVGRRGTIVSDQEGGLGRVLEQYVPAMETMSIYHDALVGFLTNKGVPDLLANIPTMAACYQAAWIMEIAKTPGYIFDALKELFDRDQDKDSNCK